MEQLEQLQTLFADADGQLFTIHFTDADVHRLKIISTTHVLLNDTVWGVPITENGATDNTTPGIEFNLLDVERVEDFRTGQLLFPATQPVKGSRAAFEAALARVPNAPPDPHDAL